MPDLTTTLLVIRSHLRDAAGAFTGRSTKCAYRVPLLQRGPLWLAAAQVPTWFASRHSDAAVLHVFDVASGPDGSYWNTLIVGVAVAVLHVECRRNQLFGGRHLHCDLCGECSLDVGGRTFRNTRNAVAFAISELGWSVRTRPAFGGPRVVAATCGSVHTDDHDDHDYPDPE